MILRPAFLAFYCILLTSLLSCTNNHSNYSNETIVKLNNHNLKASEFAKRLSLKLKTFDALTVKDIGIITRAKNEVVDEFIIEALSVKWMQENGLQLKNSKVQEELGLLKKAYPDELTFKRTLANEGLSYDLWMENFLKRLSQKLVFEKVSEDADKPNEKETKNYYKAHKNEFRTKDQIKIRQIVLKNENNAQKILKELRKGRNFGQLAKKYSVTPEAENEGKLGWIEKGSFPVFDEALKQGRGRRNKSYKSTFGFHIIEILDIKRGKQLKFSDVKDKILSTLLQQEQQKLYESWLEQQLRKSHVYKNEELLQNIYAETKR